MKKALEGIKILDLSRLVPGPFATRQLMQMGAEVTKVEHPQKPEIIRMIPPFENGVSAAYRMMNDGKDIRQIAYDTAIGKDMVYELAAAADVLVESFRPGVMADLGFSYETLRELNPQLIYISATGYGQSGPYAHQAGHDLNFMALSGLLLLNKMQHEITIPTFQLADIYGGTDQIVQAVLAGILERQKTQTGAWYDISITEATLPMAALAASAAWHKTEIATDMLSGNLPNYTVYKCRDNRHLVFAGLEAKFWRIFCELIDKPGWAAIAITELANRPDIKNELTEFFKTKTRAEWLSFFEDYDICISPVLTVQETLEDPHFKARGIFQYDKDAKIPEGWHLGVRKIK
ncbi:CoA transferase [Sphingobacterium psychroaquaticum]|uniref:CaiB/BaiF CoA transferase family protein n=1 Tax=Sphingobacterium psychroaquaticum TaxID=561061 RepID=UPI00106B5E42|nr:CaiB/BaiF CoA-transferase family protein [Sphingobacterium psychroaquaticum]QBQ40499.1 CoA transferase [Sphingobacterium psychroaquaticum]